ncbi:MAG: recombinase family protein [Streptosporangiaceae bacterium]
MAAEIVSSNLPIDIYARVSQLKRNEKREPSTDGQVSVCRVRLIDLGLAEGKVLVDPGRSAWNPAIQRPAWDELMERLERGVSGGFIVFDLERFTRQPKDGERMIGVAARGLLVLDSESEYDLRTPNGKKAFRDAINAAAYYSDRLSTRSARGKKLKAMAGEPNGSARPFGFEDDRVTQREDEAAVLRELTTRLLDGELPDALVADLNARQIPTGQGKPWTPTALKTLLTRQRNCGRIIYTDPASGLASVVGRLPGDPIVSEEDFDRATAIYAARRRGRPSSPHYLCSSFAVCGQPGCGHVLHGRPRNGLKPYPDGSVRRSYWCNPSSGGCGKTEVDQRALDSAARALAVEILSDTRNADEIEHAAREAASEAVRLDIKIAEAEAVAEALTDRLGRGEITLARYDLVIRPVDERIASLRAERAALPDPGPVPGTQPSLGTSRAQWRQRWDTADYKGKRDLLTMALRGKHLVIQPAQRGRGGADQADIVRRITIE